MTNLELKVINHCKEIIDKTCGINSRIDIERNMEKLLSGTERHEPVLKLIMEKLKEAENVKKWLEALIENKNT